MTCRHPNNVGRLRCSTQSQSSSILPTAIFHSSPCNLIRKKKKSRSPRVTTIKYSRLRPYPTEMGSTRQLQKSKLRWASALKGILSRVAQDLLVVGLDRMCYLLARERDAHSHGRSALIFQQHVCNYDSRKISMAR